MGNKTSSNVTSGVKKQAAGGTGMYKFLDLKGGGELLPLMKEANRTRDYTVLDAKITEGLKPFLENGGKGKIVHVSELVKARCEDKGILPSNSGKPHEDMDEDTRKKCEQNPSYLATLRMNPKYRDKFKWVCFSLDHRGGVGETPLHVCLLNGTALHADLAKRLLKIYQMLIYDVYISDEYYGENILHMAIVNEDPAMVKFLLEKGADVHQRACGNFFTADDQQHARKDCLDHEWFDMPKDTNYEGYTYWGEYPLGFAACLGQEECVRLLLAKGADPNLRDSNGNTVMHLLVIHENKEMFDLLRDYKANLNIKNNQELTPLTLAAKLARKEMYEHILKIEREVYWSYGNVTCAAYALEHIDTISKNGQINVNSAMYNVVYGNEPGHLDMIDGVLISNLLHKKWTTFARVRFGRRFVCFLLYFLLFVCAFYLRPGTDLYPTYEERNITSGNMTYTIVNYTIKDRCFLSKIRPGQTKEDISRFILEILVVIGSLMYIFFSIKEIYHQGYKIFFQTLTSSPGKTMFLLSNVCVLLLIPGRAGCSPTYEDVVSVVAILTTAPYFLFFCRGFKLVGPFVVMIYKMIQTDLLRFFVIYIIFVVGFSQAMYVIFRGHSTTIYNQPFESAMGMFLMSLGDFNDIYNTFDKTSYPDLPKAIFIVYMILVTLLLINMLIAMMANTYTLVNETQKEWLRQWAKIILVVEQTVTTDERRIQQKKYSQLLKDGRCALVIRWRHSEEEKQQHAESVLRSLKKTTLVNINTNAKNKSVIEVKASPEV